MQVADGVYALEMTVHFADRDVAITPSAVETDDGLLLVDTGFASAIDQLDASLAEHGFSIDDVEYVFLTHQDGDHAGGLRAILDEADATTLAHPADTPVIEGDEPPLKGPEDDRYPPAPVDVQVVDGVSIRTTAGPARVVETPGHTPGHLSLYLPDRDLLIAGDAMTADEDGLAPPNEQFTPEYSTAVESVGRLADLAVTRTLCYHGGFVDHGPDGIADLHATL